jgi:hypothetical protein
MANNLPTSQHQIVLTNLEAKSFRDFDYAIVTTYQDPSDGPSGSGGPSGSDGSSGSNVNQDVNARKNHAGTIAGGVVGGILGLALSITLFVIFYRRRIRRSKRFDNHEGYNPAPSHPSLMPELNHGHEEDMPPPIYEQVFPHYQATSAPISAQVAVQAENLSDGNAAGPELRREKGRCERLQGS